MAAATTVSKQTEKSDFMAVFPDIARNILFDRSSQVEVTARLHNLTTKLVLAYLVQRMLTRFSGGKNSVEFFLQVGILGL